MSLLIISTSPTLNAADSLRCGSHLINEGDEAFKVIKLCGHPSSESRIGTRVRLDEWGRGRELVVDEWIYGPWRGMMYFLRFEGKRLQRIQSKRIQ